MTSIEEQTNDLMSPIPLRTISQTGNVPEKRIGNISDAREILQTLVQSNRGRARKNARIKGMFDGNPPYDTKAQRDAGQLWKTNVNWLEGWAKTSAALVPYYDLFAGAKNYVNVKCDYGNPDEAEANSRIISEEVDRTLKDYDAFDFEIQRMLTDFILYGKGFEMFPDKRDWRFRCIPQSRVLFPDGTDSFSENWEVVIVRQAFRVNELYGFIRDEATAKKVGWNPRAVKRSIVNAMPQVPTGPITMYDYDFVQQMVKDHDILQGMRCSTVQAANIFVKEFDGKVSHYIFTEDATSTDPLGGASDKSPDDTFLYEGFAKYNKFSEVLAAFIFETLDGSVNGCQGLGHKLLSPMEAKNRLICAGTDLAFLRSGITLQAKDASAYQKLSMVQIGGFNVIPPEFAVQQSTIMGDMNATVQMNRMLDLLLDNNTGVYRNEGQREDGNPRTFGEVKLQYMNSTILSNSAVNRFYQCLDRLYKVVVARLCGPLPESSNEGIRMAKEFQERVMERGVPKEALREIKQVMAYRVSGNGSMLMRQQALMQMFQLYPLLPETGKQRWLQDAVASTTNHSTVERYVPQADLAKLPNDQQWAAMQENADMKISAPVTWTPTQNNTIHAQTHLLAASQAAQSLEQGANPMEVLAFLQNVGEHTAVHLQYIAQDPTRKDEFKILESQWKQLGMIADKLQGQIEQQMQQQQQNQMAQQEAQAIQSGVDPETQIKIARAEQDMAIKQAKAQQMLATKEAKTRQDLALKDARSAVDMELKRLQSQVP